MHLSDAISRFSTHDQTDAKSQARPVANFNISTHDVEELTGFMYITLKEIQSETAVDVQLEQLKKYVICGFTKTKHECTELMRFFDYRESLTIINGMVLKDKRLVIPLKLCDAALAALHRSHMGIVKTKE